MAKRRTTYRKTARASAPRRTRGSYGRRRTTGRRGNGRARTVTHRVEIVQVAANPVARPIDGVLQVAAKPPRERRF